MVLVEFVLMRDVPLSGGATRVFRHVTQLFNFQCLLALPKQHLPDFTLLICQERPPRSLSSTGMSFNRQGLELCGCGRLEPFVLILTPPCFAFRNLVPPEVTTVASSVRPLDKFGFSFPKTENEFSADRSFSMRGCSSCLHHSWINSRSEASHWKDASWSKCWRAFRKKQKLFLRGCWCVAVFVLWKAHVASRFLSLSRNFL